MLGVASSLGAQKPAPAARPDTVVSAARAPRIPYVAKRSRADTLRGSFTTPARRWWDVTFYDLHVDVRPADSTVAGWNAITYRVVETTRAPVELQIDLMEPLVLDSVVQEGHRLPLRHEGNAHFAALSTAPRVGTRGASASPWRASSRGSSAATSSSSTARSDAAAPSSSRCRSALRRDVGRRTRDARRGAPVRHAHGDSSRVLSRSTRTRQKRYRTPSVG